MGMKKEVWNQNLMLSLIRVYNREKSSQLKAILVLSVRGLTLNLRNSFHFNLIYHWCWRLVWTRVAASEAVNSWPKEPLGSKPYQNTKFGSPKQVHFFFFFARREVKGREITLWHNSPNAGRSALWNAGVCHLVLKKPKKQKNNQQQKNPPHYN